MPSQCELTDEESREIGFAGNYHCKIKKESIAPEDCSDEEQQLKREHGILVDEGIASLHMANFRIKRRMITRQRAILKKQFQKADSTNTITRAVSPLNREINEVRKGGTNPGG